MTAPALSAMLMDNHPANERGRLEGMEANGGGGAGGGGGGRGLRRYKYTPITAVDDNAISLESRYLPIFVIIDK